MKILRIFAVTLLTLAVVLGAVACGDVPVDTTEPTVTDPVDTDPVDTDPVDTEPVETDPHEHVWAAVRTLRASCVEEGYTLYECSCGETKQDDFTPKGDHVYEKTEVAATCTANGKLVYTCSACGERYEETGAAATGHAYTEKVTAAATCSAEGVVTYTCACGDSYTRAVPKKEHEYIIETTVEPTCTSDGENSYLCQICGDIYHVEILAATGHSYLSVVTAPTCKTDGYTTHTCPSCGDSYTDNVVEANEAYHSYTLTTIVAPTEAQKAAYPTALGVTQKTCSACGDSIDTGDVVLIHLDFEGPATDMLSYIKEADNVSPYLRSEAVTSGKVENGKWYNTTADQVLFNDDSGLKKYNEYTLSFDFQLYANGVSGQDDFCIGVGACSSSAAAGYFFQLGISDDGKLQYFRNWTLREEPTKALAGFTFTDRDAWYHIELTVNVEDVTVAVSVGKWADQTLTKLENFELVGVCQDTSFNGRGALNQDLFRINHRNGVRAMDNFLVTIPDPQAKCDHSKGTTTNTVAPTCDKDGYVETICVSCGFTTVVVNEGTSLGGHKIDTFVGAEDGVETWACSNDGCDATETRQCVFGETQHADATCTADGGDYQLCTNAGCNGKNWLNFIPGGHLFALYKYGADGALIGTGVEGIPSTVPTDKVTAGALFYEYYACSRCNEGEWKTVFVDLDFNAANDTTAADYLNAASGIGGFVKNGSNNAAGTIKDGALSINKTQQSLAVPEADLSGLDSFRISFDAKVRNVTGDGVMLGFGRGSYGSAAAAYYFCVGINANQNVILKQNFTTRATYTAYTVDSSKWQHFDLDVDMVKGTVTVSVGYYADEARTQLEGYITLGTMTLFKANDGTRELDILSFANGTGKTHTPVELLDNYQVFTIS